MRKKLLTLALATGLACFAFTGKAEAAGSSEADAPWLRNGVEVSDSFRVNSDYSKTVNYYKISLSKSGRLTINARTNEQSARIEIIDSVTKKSVDSYEYIGQDKQETYYKDLLAGNYIITVSGTGYKNEDNSYSFQPVFTPYAESFPETLVKKDDPCATANAMTFGKTYVGYLGVNDLMDTYKFTLAKDSVLRMNVSGGMKSLDFIVLDSRGAVAKSNYAFAATGSTTISKAFNPFMLKKGTYYLRVNTSKSYTGNYAFAVNRTDLGWAKDSKGWVYQNEYGTYYSGNKQYKIGNKYYFFDASAHMKTGWVQSNKEWYYYDKSSGAMVTGWKKIGKKWYYFQKDLGYMYTGYRTIGNKDYYFNTSGAMMTGWLKPSGSSWHYFDSSGAEAIGWRRIGGKWYYFGKSGNMYYGGRYSINGRVYRFSDSGVCLNP